VLILSRYFEEIGEILLKGERDRGGVRQFVGWTLNDAYERVQAQINNRRHNDDEQRSRGAQTNGTKERISNRLGRRWRDQSPSDESPEDDSVEDSDDREPNDEEDDRGYERELREFVYLDQDSVV